jgi:four helix bundle protein
MAGLQHANSFRDLHVYQKARKVSQEIFLLTKKFPKEETYSLTDQIRRSSRSIDAQVAEAWGKRRYQKHFVSKLSDAGAEQLETQHWCDVASDCGDISSDQHAQLNEALSEIGRMLSSMIAKASQFCGPTEE